MLVFSSIKIVDVRAATANVVIELDLKYFSCSIEISYKKNIVNQPVDTIMRNENTNQCEGNEIPALCRTVFMANLLRNTTTWCFESSPNEDCWVMDRGTVVD